MRVRAFTLLVGIALILPTGADAGPGDTAIVEVFTNATAEITPGLCAPGDPPGCVGPEIAQFRFLSTGCTVNGRFEGTDLPASAPCSFAIYGFQVGLDGGKPVCGATRFWTSDETTAFGPGSVSTFTVNGVTRRIVVEGYSLAAAVGFTRAEWDDEDADTDPEGDHVANGPPIVVRRDSSGSGIPCVTSPLDKATFPGGMVVHT